MKKHASCFQNLTIKLQYLRWCVTGLQINIEWWKNWESTNKPLRLWSIDFRQMYQDIIGREQYLQYIFLGQPDIHMKRTEFISEIYFPYQTTYNKSYMTSSQHIHKVNSMDYKPKWKWENYKTLRKKFKSKPFWPWVRQWFLRF